MKSATPWSRPTRHTPTPSTRSASSRGAERVVKKVHGVRAVVSDFEVRLRGAGERTDADIARAVIDTLKGLKGYRFTRLEAPAPPRP
jgi:hypothetical protein